MTPLFHLLCVKMKLLAEQVTFWERAAHSLNRMFSLYYVYWLLRLFSFLVSMGDTGSDGTSSWSMLTFLPIIKRSGKN